MAWVKIPVENHPVFLAALPKDPRIQTLKMFGGVAAKVNGQMFAGLFARSMIVKLSEDDQKEAMKIDGSEPFDPMGNKRIMNNTILLGESVMEDPAEMRDWLTRALAFTSKLPPKQAKATKPTTPKRKVARAVARSKASAPSRASKAPRTKPRAKRR